MSISNICLGVHHGLGASSYWCQHTEWKSEVHHEVQGTVQYHPDVHDRTALQHLHVHVQVVDVVPAGHLSVDDILGQQHARKCLGLPSTADPHKLIYLVLHEAAPLLGDKGDGKLLFVLVGQNLAQRPRVSVD